MAASDKLVIVTRKTALEELVERFNTRDQARFYIDHMGGRFDEYQAAHDAYHHALDFLHGAIPRGVRTQWIDRSFLPTFTFGESDVAVILGQDGLVVNAAKYLDGQPVVALNPDPARIDGVLLPFSFHRSRSSDRAGARVGRPQGLAGRDDGSGRLERRTIASGRQRPVHRPEDAHLGPIPHPVQAARGGSIVEWNHRLDGRRLDRLESLDLDRRRRNRCGVAKKAKVKDIRGKYRFDWEARYLVFNVREPFPSKTTGAEIIHGVIDAKKPFEIVSHMPQNGVIFSDGIEEDRLEFNSGAHGQDRFIRPHSASGCSSGLRSR